MLSREICRKCAEFESVGEDEADWICGWAEDDDTPDFWVCANSRIPKGCPMFFEQTIALAGKTDVKS